MSKKIGRSRAHTNIALIKYWGKRNEELFLPTNSSLSLTLDAFYTDTQVEIDSNLNEDVFFLDDKKQSQKETEKISHFLDLFRKYTGEDSKAIVTSYNHVPTAAGLASSASAFAALAKACDQAFETYLDPATLSTFARQGSGSATRSIFGGFVEWNKGSGNDSSTSKAIEIDDASWDIGMIVIAINTGKKKLSSREGMRLTVDTSPFYPVWVETAGEDLLLIKEAITNKDFVRLGEITESNGMKMHGSMLGATPPISYWEPGSVLAIEKIKEIRNNGIPCYVTMDAGPNVKVLCKKSQMAEIIKELRTEFDESQLIASGVGPGSKYLSADEWSY